jgi:hypothetical protein
MKPAFPKQHSVISRISLKAGEIAIVRMIPKKFCFAGAFSNGTNAGPIAQT